MAYIYEVNGQRVEFEREPTEKDIDEAARGLRPAAESRQPKPVEGQGGAAFGVYRPQGRRPESQQDREAAKDMPLQTARGVVTGTLGAIPDVLNLPGVLYSAATGQPSPYTVPLGSESWNEMLPGKSDAPSAKLARLGGEVMAPFPTAKGLQTIPKAAGAVGDVVSGAVGTGTGYIARPGRAPRGYQVASQRNPIGATFTPPEEFAKFERGELPYGQMPEQRPISELPEGRLDKAAMMLSGGNIPNAGQGARAFGERLGETYRNPITAAADIGSMFFTGGVPVLTTLRGGLAGAQALADMRLANKGFTPELPKILEEYQTGVRPLPGVQPGPMPRGFQAAGPVSPAGMSTPAAQAAQATTQAKVRQTQPRQPAPPRAQAEWTMPTAEDTFNAAKTARPSHQQYEAFTDAVNQRTQDILKQARREGRNLSPEAAANQAEDEIRAVRRNSQQPAPTTGPTLAQEGEAPALVKTRGEGTLDKPNVEFDRTDWFALQEKVRSGKPLTAGEQSLADKITGRYGPDPFGSGDITGNKMFNTTAVNEPVPVAQAEPTAAIEPTPVVETPKQTRDMSVGNAKKQFYKDLEDDTIPVEEAMKKYESVTAKKQLRVYNEAYDAAIAQGKDDQAAKQAGKQALQRNGLPPLTGERSTAKLKPKDSDIMEKEMAQSWFDDTVKNAPDKQTKQMYQDMLEQRNGDVAQLYRDLSAQQAGKETGKSFFEEPLNTGMTETKTTPTTKSELKQGETFTSKDDDFDEPRFTGIEKELVDKIPKKTEWVKETRYMDANGKIAITEYYSKATKNQPEYKFVDKFINEADDSSELYVKKGNNWELVADEKTIIGAKDAARKAEYEQKMKAYYEPIRQEINMTFDEFMALPEDKLIELGKQIKKSKSNKPKGVMEMMIPENDFTKDLTMAKMSGGDLPVGSFEKDGIRYEVVENAAYKNMPDAVKKLVPDMPKTIERQIDIKTGKVLKGPKSMAELQAEAEEMLKQSRAAKKKQGK